MTLRRLSSDCESADWSCPGVWEEGEYLDDVIVVGTRIDPSPVPLGPGQVAIRLPRRVVRNAQIV